MLDGTVFFVFFAAKCVSEQCRVKSDVPFRSTGPAQPVDELDVTGMTPAGRRAPIGEADL